MVIGSKKGIVFGYSCKSYFVRLVEQPAKNAAKTPAHATNNDDFDKDNFIAINIINDQ
jgi:hypothetical protein